MLTDTIFFTMFFRSATPNDDDDEEEDDVSSDPVSGTAGDLGAPQVKEVDAEGKDPKIVSLYCSIFVHGCHSTCETKICLLIVGRYRE